MHVLTIPEGLSEPIPIAGGVKLESGKSYICPNAFVGQLFLSQWRVIINGEMWPMRSVLTARPWSADTHHAEHDWNHKELWLYRGGGIGDILMMTPLIRHLKRTWPQVDIHVACGAHLHCIFDGMGITPEYIPIEDDGTNRTIISFEDVIEGDPKAEYTHSAKMFADRLGIELFDTRPMYFVSKEEYTDALSQYPRNHKKRIAIQFLASGLYRSYPKMQEVMTELAKEAEVFLFGAPGQVKLDEHIPNVFNLMEDGLTIRESFAVLSTCDSCVAPDSALVHVCSALDIPCVGLYGPFPSELRVTSHRAIAFNGKAPCSPCFFHANLPTDFPAGMPCSESKRCVALDNIPVDVVVKAALSCC